MMNSKIQRQFDRLEQQRLALLDRLSRMDLHAYTYSPDGKWCVGQILTHLITSERLALSYMKKKSLGSANLKDSGIREEIILFVLKVSQRLPIKYKAPKAISDHTPEPYAFDDMVSRWSKARIQLRDFLQELPAEYSRRKIFKHPIAGMLDVRQGLAFMYEHVLHHQPQIDRLLKQV